MAKKNKNPWKISTYFLIGAIVVLIVVMLLGNSGEVPSQPNSNVGVDDDAVLGSPNAEVTIIEFSDYQCIFCRKFWKETLPQIKSEYIDTGKVKLVYRDLPLDSIHPGAQKAAEAAECVRKDGGDSAYFQMHDKIFEEQDKVNPSGTVAYTNQDLKNWASEIGYDISSCLDSGEFYNEVRADLADAQKAGGRGTPFFLVNGEAVSGAQPFQVFRDKIESYL